MGLKQVARSEQGVPQIFHVVVSDGMGENLHKVFDANARRFHLLGVIERRVQPPRVNVSPAIPKTVAFKTVEVKIPNAIPLKNSDFVVAAFQQQFN